MKKIDYLVKSFIYSGAILVYVVGVAWFMFNGEDMFGKAEGFIAPLLVLLTLIISASITGLLVLGKPIHLYLSGAKKEGIIMFLANLAWLIAFVVALIVFF